MKNPWNYQFEIFLFNLESESSTNRHPMTEHLAITDEVFYGAKKRCGGDHVMLTWSYVFYYRIRKEYLEQLESWKVSLVAKTKDELANKASETFTDHHYKYSIL